MPIIKSAKKRVKTAAKANIRNAQTKRQVREALKTFAKALEGGKAAEITKAENQAKKALDTAVKKAIIHKNKAARQKAQLAVKAKAAGAKPVKVAVKVSPAKKPVAKKAAPKK